VYEATARAGAPANGVRFILYSLGTNGQPVYRCKRSLRRFQDESAAGTDKLHITVVVGATTFVIHDRVQLRHHVVQLQSGGFVSDGTRRLDLSITTAGTTPPRRGHPLRPERENAHIRLTETFVTLSASSSGLRRHPHPARSEVIATSGNLHHHRLGDIVFRHRQLYRDREWSGLRDHHTIGRRHGVVYRSAGADLTADEIAALTAVFSEVTNLIIGMDDLLLPVF